MTEEHTKLLHTFDNRISLLLQKLTSYQSQLATLHDDYERKNKELMHAHKEIVELQEKYDNLKVAKTVSLSKQEIKDGKMRLSKMMREIDNCISLLNE